MNLLNALRFRLLLNAPTEGTQTPTQPAETAPTNEPAPAGTLLDGVTPPAPAEGEGGKGVAAPEPVAPLTREDLALPEGFEDAVLETRGEGEAAVSVTALDRALEIMNNGELTAKERTQQLVELQTGLAKRAAEAAEAAWTGMQNQWRQEAQALPEIGGDRLPQTLASIKKGLEVVGVDKTFYEAMALTGAGNHPAVIRALHALTKNLSEGKPVSGDPPKGQLSKLAAMYPTMQPKE